MADPQALLPLDAALTAVLSRVQPLPVETVPLHQACGRVLARDAVADLDQPAFDRSAMDGIAVRAADAVAPGAVLRELGEAPAGQPWAGHVQSGSCVRIMTGGVVPAGADAVVPVERIQAEPAPDGGRQYRLLDVVVPEANIARRGSEVRAGDVVVPSGGVLTGARVGVLGTFGHTRVEVRRQPVVALLPTGSEIVPVDQAPGPGQVRDANRYALTGLLAGAGALVLQEGVAPDRRDELAASLRAAWDRADVVVTSGGVSAGDYDLVAPALQDLGATCHVHKIRIKPGKPFLFATLGDKLAFGLPGNPISAYVCCALFVLPALAALQGAQAGWQVAALPTRSPVPAVGPRSEVLPARLVRDGDATLVDVLPVRGSADLAHFARADWMVLRPAGGPPVPAGGLVDVLLWPRP